LDVEVAGRWFTVPALDALQWLMIISDEGQDLYDIFPRLAGQEAIEWVEDALWDGRINEDELAKLALEIIAVAADRPWWLALRTVSTARTVWDRVFVNTAAGMSLAGWLDQVWGRLMMVSDPTKVTSWIHQMETPPKGVDVDVDFDAEEHAFQAAMNAVAR
jgi:hypothetical protein